MNKKQNLATDVTPWPIKWRHQYDHDRDKKEGDAAIIDCGDEVITQQQFTEDANINTIARRFGLDKLSQLPPAPVDPSHYGDLTNVPTLRDLLEIGRDAKEKFLALPSKLRERFNNDPSKLWAFVNDPENAEEAVRLGLLKERPKTAPPGQDDILAQKIASEIRKAQKEDVSEGNNKTPPEAKAS